MENEEGQGSSQGREIQEILLDLERAWEEDQRLNEEGRPAVEKLHLMESVYSRLLKKKNEQELLDAGVLRLLRMWLEPLPDKSLPHEEIKKSVLEILLHLAPEVEHLQESGIGRIVFFYSKNPYEKKQIRRVAKQLVLKWIETATEEEE